MPEVHPIPTNPRFKNLIGQRFGRLTVTAFAGPYPSGGFLWLCRCDCGKEAEVAGKSLGSGLTQSCGCYGRERYRDANTHHGMHGTKVYQTWKNVLSRCRNPKDPNYAGRGVQVCQGLQDFTTFYAALGNPPPDESGRRRSNFSIDRKRNEGHYSCGDCPQCRSEGWPLNVQWATQKQQCRNQRKNLLITYEGRTQTASAWAEEFKIPTQTVVNRIRLGWDFKDIISLPPSRIPYRNRVKTAGTDSPPSPPPSLGCEAG